jgi:CRP-like cAMP-binding protein
MITSSIDWNFFESDLSVENKKKLVTDAINLNFKRGDFVYQHGDHPKGLYLVKTGLVGLIIVGSTSGKEHLLRFFREGQFFGHRALFSNEEYHASSVVLEPTEIVMIPKDIILSLIENNPNLLKKFVQVLCLELRRSETHQVMILENEVLVRIAQSLVYLKDLHPEHNWTRQEIANFCASTTSTVIKALADIEALGFIKQDGREIHILNRTGLIALQDRDELK